MANSKDETDALVKIKRQLSKRLQAGGRLEDIQQELISSGYPKEDVEKASTSFDWKAEVKHYRESPEKSRYEKVSEATEHKKLLFTIILVAVAFLFMLIFGPCMPGEGWICTTSLGGGPLEGFFGMFAIPVGMILIVLFVLFLLKKQAIG